MTGIALLVSETIITYSTIAFFTSLYFWSKKETEQNKIFREILHLKSMRNMHDDLGYDLLMIFNGRGFGTKKL